MEDIFNSLIDSALVIKELFKEDTAIVIEDKEKILLVSEGETIKPPNKAGDKVEDNIAKDKLKANKKTTFTTLTKEQHGVDLKLTHVPIKDLNNNYIGTFCLMRNTQRENSVANISEKLMDSIKETNNKVNVIEDDATKLSDNLNIIIDRIEKTSKSINESSGVIDLISNISKQLNMLGLNASIEAARAGEQGKGFSIVASEIRKLSLVSQESAKEIFSYLQEMRDSIEVINNSIGLLGDVATNQAESIEDVSKTLNEISLSSHKLVENAKMD
ncbi:methyl-accepting chemotaxis protein [Inconstantimicrobium mannanitabidum]|uniref:Methyl-accepting chemotaxis protein n=1 Tax=Inconstantimicrobium mannanitabidum TaxID=1604901 RepID=A0ACB5R9H1_9CLOT|nr:methyl-accepting chemotaxis protein [Clostridium sp. TW13]GKX65755.1 methyl-accepting chemotaxis protein [Clostridium sp. TW13]